MSGRRMDGWGACIVAAKCAWPAAAAPWVLAVRSLVRQARVLVAAAFSMVVSYKRRCPGKPPIIAT